MPESKRETHHDESNLPVNKSGREAETKVNVDPRSTEVEIVVFCAYYSSHGGGMELACERLVRDLIAGGRQVRWLAQLDGALPDFPISTCVPFCGTDIIYRKSGIPFPIPFPSTFSTAIRAVKRSSLVVIVEANFLISVLAYLLARYFSKKILVVQHVGRPSTVSRLARLAMGIAEALFTRRVISRADAVVYVSPVVAKHFEGVRGNRATEIIGHAIDTGLFSPPTTVLKKETDRDEFNLPRHGKQACFVGRITESKGVLVIRALAEMRPDWTFVIAGSGPIDPRKWGMDNVFALGKLSQRQVAQLYRCSDAMVLPSQSESFSLVVREAMASGCAVICGDQILDTDPGLAPFVETIAINLTDVNRTARGFSTALDKAAPSCPDGMREYVVRECSQDQIRNRYLNLISRLLSTGET